MIHSMTYNYRSGDVKPHPGATVAHNEAIELAVLKRSRGVHSSGDIKVHLKTMETHLRAMAELRRLLLEPQRLTFVVFSWGVSRPAPI